MSSVPDFHTAPLARRFSYGVGLLGRALSWMVRKPALWPWIVLPVLLTAGLLVGAFTLTWTWGTDLTLAVFPRPESATWTAQVGRALWWVSNAVVHLVLFLVLAILSWFLGNAVASPFYERLSAKVEEIVRGRPADDPFSLGLLAVDIYQGVTHTLASLTLWAALACPASALNLVPVVGQAAALVLGGLISGFFIAREALDHAMSRRRLGLRRKLGLCWAHLATVEGLGVAITALLAIPFANFLSMPAAAIAGTFLYLDLQDAGLIVEDPPPPPRPPTP